MKQYCTIPIFIPESACPFRCVYCNQYHIANLSQPISPQESREIIEKYLQTIHSHQIKTIAFFGGSFTGLAIDNQNQYLDIALEYKKAKKIDRIQLSTRPDYISKAILDNLKQHQVDIIELGAQSLDEQVLKNVHRGHTVQDVVQAAKLINEYQFELGLQMMIGLPSDTLQKSIQTAKQIVELKAKNTRIYPTLVIKDTALEQMYKENKYTPLSITEAVDWSAYIYKIFVENNIKVLRLGLHPSEGLMSGKNLIAGPFHVSFKELVYSEIWKRKIIKSIDKNLSKTICISVHSSQINFAIGYGKSNKKFLASYFNDIKFLIDNNLKEEEFKITYI